jgi:hypothetical protein
VEFNFLLQQTFPCIFYYHWLKEVVKGKSGLTKSWGPHAVVFTVLIFACFYVCHTGLSWGVGW